MRIRFYYNNLIRPDGWQGNVPFKDTRRQLANYADIISDDVITHNYGIF